MNEPLLLHDISLIFGLAALVLMAGHRLRVPPIVGLFLTGILAGPHGLGLVRDVRNVDAMAQVGVVLLLFTIGIEFSFKHLLQVRRAVFLGGGLQVGLTTLAVYFALVRWGGFADGAAVLIGIMIAMTSTTVGIKLLQDRAEVDTPHARSFLGISIFQDLFSVPAMLCIPLLAGQAGSAGDAAGLLARAAAIVALTVLAARWAVPWILYQVVRTRSRELFLMTIALIGLGVAGWTASLGLSLALGAFLAGLIVSESEYSQHALSNVLPLRDIFAGLFFISVGMLLEVDALRAQPWSVAAWTVGVLGVKLVGAAAAGMALGLPLRTVLMIAVLLSQMGEFSFILSTVGLQNGLIEPRTYQLLLAVSVVTMALSPFAVGAAPRIIDAVERLPLPRPIRLGWAERGGDEPPAVRDHLVIVGFGLTGRTLARAAQVGGIPFRIVEMNPDTVRAERARGTPIFFGDASEEAVLRRAGVPGARVLAIVINDAAAVRKIVATARALDPGLAIIARTRYWSELPSLRALGADEVICEEFETSVEIFTRVLRRYLVPADDIERLAAEVRADGYQMLRPAAAPPVQWSDLSVPLPDHEIVALRVVPGAPADGRTLGELDLRRHHGVTVLAIRRGDAWTPNPAGRERLLAGDVAVLFGRPQALAAAGPLFRMADG